MLATLASHDLSSGRIQFTGRHFPVRNYSHAIVMEMGIHSLQDELKWVASQVRSGKARLRRRFARTLRRCSVAARPDSVAISERGCAISGRLSSQVPPNLVQLWSGDVFRGLEHLHRNHIIHRDLKPPNIMLNIDPGTGLLRAQVIDLVSNQPILPRRAAVGAMTRNCEVGTCWYRAPELLLPAWTPLGFNPRPRA